MIALDGSKRSITGAVLVAPVGASCLVVAMKVMDLAGVSSIGVVVFAAIVFAAALAVVAAGLRPRRLASVGIGRWEVLPVLTMAGVMVGLWSRALHRVLDTPVVFGVDPARHVSMTAWIVEHQRLVHGVEPQLGSLSGYPPGAHVLAATASWATGASPLATTWLVALGATAVTVLLVACLAGEVLPQRSLVPGAVAMCLCLVAWRFTIGMITYEFYFSQVVGLTLSVGGVLSVVRGLRAGETWWRWTPLALVASVASFLTYPQQALVVPAALAVALLMVWRGDRPGFSARALVLALAVTAGVGALAAVVLQRSGYLTSGALFGTDDGFVTTLALSRVGGWVPCVMVAAGTAVLLRWARRRSAPAATLLAAFAVPVGLASGLWLLQHGVPVRVDVTDYRIAKNVFTAVPFAAAAAGIGVASVPRPAWARSRALALATAFVTVLIPWQPRHMSNTLFPVVSRDAYDLARWASSRYDVTDIGMVGADLEPFYLWVTGLRRPLDPDPGVALLPISTKWSDWPVGPEDERYLLVSGRRAVARYSARPGVELVRRLGNAALFHSGG